MNWCIVKSWECENNIKIYVFLKTGRRKKCQYNADCWAMITFRTKLQKIISANCASQYYYCSIIWSNIYCSSHNIRFCVQFCVHHNFVHHITSEFVSTTILCQPQSLCPIQFCVHHNFVSTTIFVSTTNLCPPHKIWFCQQQRVLVASLIPETSNFPKSNSTEFCLIELNSENNNTWSKVVFVGSISNLLFPSPLVCVTNKQQQTLFFYFFGEDSIAQM